MTQEERNEVLRHIEVEKAYLDGNEIEYKILDGDWETCSRPLWNWSERDYRIKPKPQYVPFDSADEITQAIKEHSVVLKRIATGTRRIIREFDSGFVWIGRNDIGDSFASVFDNYTFADGTPFGKLIEK